MHIIHLPIVILLICFFSPTKVFASGWTTHVITGLEMLNKHIDDNKMLKKILNDNKNAYKTGLLFPDAAKTVFKGGEDEIGNNPYCDFTHIQNAEKTGSARKKNIHCKGWSWPQVHANRLVSRCLDIFDERKKQTPCKKSLSFLIGALTHMITDAHFDAHFIGKSSAKTKKNVLNNCFEKDINAEGFTDRDMDICLAAKLDGIKFLGPKYTITRRQEFAKWCYAQTGELGIAKRYRDSYKTNARDIFVPEDATIAFEYELGKDKTYTWGWGRGNLENASKKANRRMNNMRTCIRPGVGAVCSGAKILADVDPQTCNISLKHLTVGSNNRTRVHGGIYDSANMSAIFSKAVFGALKYALDHSGDKQLMIQRTARMKYKVSIKDDDSFEPVCAGKVAHCI